MKKNVASQVIGVQMTTAADGTAFTGAVTALITIDGGTQSASGGTGPTHEGNGFHTYLPTQAETNGDHIAFTFTGTGAITSTVQVFTTFPQTGDNFARLGAPAGASVSADVAAVKVDTAATLIDTAEIGTAGAGLTNINLPNQTMDIVGNITGNLSGSVGSVTGAVGSVTGAVGSVTAGVTVTTNNDKTGYTVSTVSDKTGYSISGTKTTLDALNDIAATSIVSGGAINTTAGAVDSVTLVATTTTNTDMRGTDSANTVAPDNAGITANGVAIAALNNLSAAQVNAEVLDVFNTDTFAELGSVPAATSTLVDKISWIFTLHRNKITQTATLQSVRNDADSSSIATSVTSGDGTTTVKGEYS